MDVESSELRQNGINSYLCALCTSIVPSVCSRTSLTFRNATYFHFQWNNSLCPIAARLLEIVHIRQETFFLIVKTTQFLI